ncbi:hypothetical protein RQP46_009161 [Phenoliferia psychrophenolica]
MPYDYLTLTQSGVRVLNLTQRVSAMSFSTFLVLHLSAPIASAIAPSGKAESYASGFMLLGRVWYQGEWTEAAIVWGSLAVHIASGSLGRLVKAAERAERRKRRRREVLFSAEKGTSVEEELDATVVPRVSTSSGERDDEDELLGDEIKAFDEITPKADVVQPAPFDFLGPFTLTHLAGYIMIPMTLNHAFLHRILPSSPSPPISSLSPTLFSYSYVAYALSAPSHRTKSAIAYSALVVVAGYHAISGIRRLIDPMAPRGLKPKRAKDGEGRIGAVKRRGWQGVYLGGVMAVGLGLVRLASEGKGVPEWIGRKYEVVLSH